MLFLLLLLIGALHENSALRSRRGERIFNGSEAPPGEFPFIAALIIETKEYLWLCGGALISDEYVLTAGHCIDGAVKITVQLGSNSLNKTDENRVALTTSEYVVYPGFNPQTLENDIGVVRLPSLVTFTDYIAPICLPHAEIEEEAQCTTMGWGYLRDSDTEFPDELHFVNASTIKQSVCINIFGIDVIKDSVVCAIGRNVGTTCIGDSGGPLIENRNGTILHVGVASFISEHGCESADPAGFTRTFKFLEWLGNFTNTTCYY